MLPTTFFHYIDKRIECLKKYSFNDFLELTKNLKIKPIHIEELFNYYITYKAANNTNRTIEDHLYVLNDVITHKNVKITNKYPFEKNKYRYNTINQKESKNIIISKILEDAEKYKLNIFLLFDQEKIIGKKQVIYNIIETKKL